MPSIGPQLPPQPSKRKRTPSPPPSNHPSPQKTATRPPNNNTNADEIDLDLDPEDEDSPAPAIGPSLPPSTKTTIGPSPTPSSETTIGPSKPPPSAPNANPQPDPDSDSDSDSYGPLLPSSAPRPSIGPSLPPAAEDPAPKRDAWMLAPPPAKTTYTERDPTRLRARKFASKPSANPSSSSSSQPSIWTETPEEKLRRLQDSVLGRSTPANPSSQAATRAAAGPIESDRERNIAAAIQAQRGDSLYEEHGKKRRRRGAAAADEEDDPSKRAFDRDKDMALGGKITTAQRRELVSKSANFGGRFQKGSYL
ncbi:hypothetical protein CP533_3852 [Ophiocordyceps camponoti-saundersi (nom. inval.)]|nr:hypothetical protein CP533_3852 [Ophiocordyceps camponoti-saundersi (nom. inval.)]